MVLYKYTLFHLKTDLEVSERTQFIYLFIYAFFIEGNKLQ